jgi:aminoglycoside phosphotransferase (APT) family kinase protein
MTDVAAIQIAGLEARAAADCGAREVAKWHQVYVESAAMRVPVLDLAFAWLAHNTNAVSGRIALVHNDLRIGNLIVEDGRIAAIVDWETAQLTDPAADLAKFNLAPFRGRAGLASGLVEFEVFLRAYEVASGWRPEQRTLDFWTTLEIAKNAVGAIRGLHYFATGQSSDIRYANLGFQVHHSLRWLVEDYEQGVWGRPS